MMDCATSISLTNNCCNHFYQYFLDQFVLVSVMNPAFNAVAFENKVAPETEYIFNDDFFESLDMVCTALDNVEARLYIDQKCLFYLKPMLESGTLGQ